MNHLWISGGAHESVWIVNASLWGVDGQPSLSGVYGKSTGHPWAAYRSTGGPHDVVGLLEYYPLFKSLIILKPISIFDHHKVMLCKKVDVLAEVCYIITA